MILLDSAHREVIKWVLKHPPERGGALMGPVNRALVSRFLFDAAAVATTITYTPSASLVRLVAEVESSVGLEFKGILHSHPSGVIGPSEGDRAAVTSFFEHNPHHSDMYLPIAFPSYKHGLGKWLSSIPKEAVGGLVGYRAVRARLKSERATRAGTASGPWRRSHPHVIVPDEITIVPVQEGAEILKDTLYDIMKAEITVDPQLVELQIGHVEMFGYLLTEPRFELIYLATADYPVGGPTLLLTRTGKGTHQVPICWGYLETGHQASVIAVAEAAVGALGLQRSKDHVPRGRNDSSKGMSSDQIDPCEPVVESVNSDDNTRNRTAPFGILPNAPPPERPEQIHQEDHNDPTA